MAEPTETTPIVVEPPVVETPKVETTPVVEAKVEGTETPKVESAKTEPVVAKVEEPKPDWKDKRIAQLTARLRESEKPKVVTPTSVTPPVAVAAGTPEFDAAVETRAKTLAEQQAAQIAFNRACDDLAKVGQEAFPDFTARINNFQNIVDNNNQAEISAYYNMVAVAIETGEGARILHELGGDLNEAARIMALHPTKMAVELTKLATGASPRREISQAPKPITPIGRTPSNNAEIKPDDPERGDKLSTAEWMKRREAQAAERYDRENPRKRRA